MFNPVTILKIIATICILLNFYLFVRAVIDPAELPITVFIFFILNIITASYAFLKVSKNAN